MWPTTVRFFRITWAKLLLWVFPSLQDGNRSSSKALKGHLSRKFIQGEVTNQEIIFLLFIYSNHSLFSFSVADWFVPGFCICFLENVGMIHFHKLLPKRNQKKIKITKEHWGTVSAGTKQPWVFNCQLSQQPSWGWGSEPCQMGNGNFRQ